MDIEAQAKLMDEIIAEARAGKIRHNITVGQMAVVRWELMNDYKKAIKKSVKKPSL